MREREPTISMIMPASSKHREFARVADVYRAGDLILCRHEFDQAIDEIVDVAERPRLRAVSVEPSDLGRAEPE